MKTRGRHVPRRGLCALLSRPDVHLLFVCSFFWPDSLLSLPLGLGSGEPSRYLLPQQPSGACEPTRENYFHSLHRVSHPPSPGVSGRVGDVSFGRVRETNLGGGASVQLPFSFFLLGLGCEAATEGWLERPNGTLQGLA